jgi:glycogen operon protein
MSVQRKAWAAEEGTAYPRGVSWIEEEQAYNFVLYSKHAETVTLLLYGEDDIKNACFTYTLDYLKNKTGRAWHCRIPKDAMRGARYYAYSVSGPHPNWRFQWHSFDAQKILLDPYAKAVYFPPGFDRNAAMRSGSNAGVAPLGVITADGDCAFDWGASQAPNHESDLIIYELHVKGFTANANSGVDAGKCGTYAGLIQKIPYLKSLGVTAVELMPIFQYDPEEGSCWGYMPLCFFAPHHAYASSKDLCTQHDEFREMVKALHEADIEVILDVVYNHTCEGDERGPIYSYKGIDNSTYYMISSDPYHPYANFAGTGNTLNCGNRFVRRMILDSMRYWAKEMHVDGFRFDLASIYSRNPDGSINFDDPPIFGMISADPELSRLRLIAEPWDAAGAFQLGHSFPGVAWLQWNGSFRDDLRRFVRGDNGMVTALMQRLYGSDDLFPDDRMNAYHPYQSINYITCHDGFTMYDLVSYNHKRNEANGEDNRDGMDENFSWNCGWEGDGLVPPSVVSLRKRQMKNFCCLLLLANGTPMLRAGDEFMNSQGGNNNPFNQDNQTNWLDWGKLNGHKDLFQFFQRMIAFRKSHPSLSRSRFWREDIHWYGPGGIVDMSPESHTLAFCLHGRSQGDDDLYVMINGYWHGINFAIQEGAADQWKRVVDTAADGPRDFAEPPESLGSLDYLVGPRSVVVLIRKS